MPPLPDSNVPILVFIRPLNEKGFRYVITGGMASILYGEPRTTHDVDLILELPAHRIPELLELFPETSFYRPPVEVLHIETSRPADGHFNLIHLDSGLKADVYLVANDALHQWALAHRRPFEFEGESVSLAPPEYVILRKLDYYRMGGSQKHLRDIRAILAMEAERIDFDFLNQKMAELGLQPLWDEVRS